MLESIDTGFFILACVFTTLVVIVTRRSLDQVADNTFRLIGVLLGVAYVAHAIFG